MSNIVTEAKQKVDLSEYSDESDVEGVAIDTKKTKSKSKSKAKGNSAKPMHQTPRNLSSSSDMTAYEHDENNLSPNTAATDYSNPGLVSDRDEEDYEDEDTEMADEAPVKESVMIVDMETDGGATEETGDAVCGATRG
jgi:hypothetical protein